MKVCIYCASSARVDAAYFEATERLARELVRENVQIVYGGGAIGLMGKLADTVIDAGGTIKGIIPRFMDEVEWTHKRLSELEFTDTMHQRKAKFLEGTDALVALPGGTGTLEELFEAITLKRLGLFTKPIVILNTRDYYGPLIRMLEKCIEEQFMKKKHQEMWKFVNEPEEVLPAIRDAAPWDKNAIKFAVSQ